MTALITTADSLKALTIVRSLGRQGITVTTGSHNPSPLASYSRFSVKNVFYPSPVRNPQEFIRTIHHFLTLHPHDVLLPVHSDDTIVINSSLSSLSKVTRLPFHRVEEMIRINDKASLAHIAEELGIPIPRTWVPDDLSQVRKIANEINYPAVIKLRNRTSSTGQSYVNNPDELLNAYLKTIEGFFLSPQEYPIIQEYISGVGYGVSLLFNHGDLRAKFTHKRIREFPVSGGPSTCRVSTRHHGMEELATRLLRHFSWHGIAMVEFKLTSEGNPILLEVNPRFWGSINQAVQAGVDFPYLLYQMAIDGDVRSVLSYQEGVVTRNSILDMCSYIQGIRRKTAQIDLNPHLQIPFHDDIFAVDDPTPFFAAIRAGVRQYDRLL